MTDATDAAVGAILEQNFGSGLHPIALASRKLNATEIRYSTYEREMLGTMWALGQWKHYFQTDSLSRQLISDALVRKGSVKDANEEYVMWFRVAADATDEDIQSALYQLSNQSVQGPQSNFKTMNEDQAPSQDSFEVKPSVIAPTAVSKLQLDNSFRNSSYSY